MTIAEAIRAYIIADGTLTTLIGTRMYPIILPQKPTLPAITYTWVSGNRPVTNDGPCGRSSPRIQFDCWGATVMDAAAVSEALRLRLNGFTGVIGGSPPEHRIQGVFFITEQEVPEPEPKLFRFSVEYYVHYEEEV